MKHDLRPIWFLLLMTMLTALGAVVILLALEASGQSDEDQAWQDYYDAAGQAGAGETVPLPDEAEPWKQWCSPGEYCPSVLNGVLGGMTWCHKGKCHDSHRARSLAIWTEWAGWIEPYSGGAPGLLMASTIRTESEGNVSGMTKSTTKECGLASIDLAHAQTADVNACDPQANIWAQGYFRNLRLIKAREKIDGLDGAPLEDQWMIAGACGAIGSHRVAALVAKSGALKAEHPYRRILKWLQWAHGKWQKVGLYGSAGTAILGTNKGKGAFRVARVWGVVRLLEDMYGGSMPWAEPVLPDRPSEIQPFPGVSKHCACTIWPELEVMRPDPWTGSGPVMP